MASSSSGSLLLLESAHESMWFFWNVGMAARWWELTYSSVDLPEIVSRDRFIHWSAFTYQNQAYQRSITSCYQSVDASG